MSNELKLLFGELVADPGVQLPLRVELVPGQTADFASASDARAVIGATRPRRLPRCTAMRPVHYWIELRADHWSVIEYSRHGEAVRANFSTVEEAWSHMLALRRSARTGALAPFITDL